MNKSRILKEANEAAKMKEKDNFILSFEASDIFKWHAFVFGPADSPFSDGIFELAINLPTNYPIQAPQVVFKTRIFHPNIHWETGEICLNVVKDEWSPYWTLEALCRAIQQLMSNPNGDSPLNCDAGSVVIRRNLVRNGDQEGYLSMARSLTEEYAISKEDFKRIVDAQIQAQNK